MVFVVGRVLHTLPDGKAVWGVTSFDNLIYVLRGKSSKEIEVYDTQSYRLQKRVTVPGLDAMSDMVACTHNVCIYISGFTDGCIHRVELPDVSVKKWPVNEICGCLSITDAHSVLVTCQEAQMIKEFSTDGKLLCQIELPQNVESPWHTIQLSSGEFLVCHGRTHDPAHRVCLIGADGHVVKSYGGPGSQKMNVPVHMVVDKNGFVFVVDFMNYRVLLLSPSLTYVREVVSRDQFKWKPQRLFLDVDRHRLYVVKNEWKNEKFTTGDVVVVSV